MWLPNNLNRWIRAVFALCVFTFPFQLNEMLYQAEWGRGFLNPYASIRLYSTEVLLLLTALLFAIQVVRKQKAWRLGNSFHLLSLMTLISIGVLSFATSPLPDEVFHFFLTAKLFELFLFYFLIINQALPLQNLLKIFVASMTSQSLLAIFQVLTQNSLGLNFLGEPSISTETVHLARFQLGNIDLLRAYGTFPHPNVLGGFLCMSLFLTFILEKTTNRQKTILLTIQGLALLASFSRSALLAFSCALILLSVWYLKHLKKKPKLPLFLGTFLLGELAFVLFSRGFNPFNQSAMLERWQGYKDALSMMKEYPLGVGWNHYTLFLDSVSNSNLMPWEYQPVHNLFLLTMAETGAVGLSALLFFVFFTFHHLYHKRKTLLTPKQLFKKRLLFVMSFSLLVITFFDHYLFTLDQGRWLLVLIFSLSSVFSADPRFIFPLKKLKGH